MRNYENYKLSLNRKENEIIDYINQNRNPNRTMDDVFNDENIEFASISMGKGRDDNEITNSVIKIAGIDKLLIDERTVVGNITENLDDRKYIAVHERDVFDTQVVLNEHNIAFDGPYESAEDAYTLDTTIDNINKGCKKNNIELGWIQKAYVIGSYRSELSGFLEDSTPIIEDDVSDNIREINDEGMLAASKGYVLQKKTVSNTNN